MPGSGLHVLGEGAIAVAPAAHDVEAFERESRRIDRCGGRRRKLGSARCLSSCWRMVTAPRISGSMAGTPAGWAVWKPRIRSMIQTPRITGEVVVPFAVTLRMLACVMIPPRTESFGSVHLAHRDSADAGDAVVFRQAFVQEREVGIDDGARRQVAVEEFLDEEAGFFDGGELERVVEFVVVVESGRWGAVVDLAEVEPVVGESVDEAAGLRVIQQAIGLGPEDFGVAEPALRGQSAEFVIRRRVPQEQRETRGEGIIIEPAGRFLNVQVARRAENRRVRGKQRFREAVAQFELLVEELEEPLGCVLPRRAGGRLARGTRG